MKSSESRLGIPEGMVRVISCHHFVSQDVFLAENEPVALCTAQEKLLVATVQHCVEVRDLDRRGHILHTFPTVDQVKQLIYCDSANYVATLERKSSRHSNPSMTYVRAYLNWWVDMKGQPMRVRIAGCGTPNNLSSVAGQLEMVELPLSDIALCIACCKETGTLAISLGRIIQVYGFSSKVHEVSKQKFRDFDHLMDLQINFAVQEVNLCEDYFACLGTNEVHVFQILLEQEARATSVKISKQNSSLDSIKASFVEKEINLDSDSDLISDDQYFVEWKFDCFHPDGIIDTEFEDTLKTKLDPASFPIEIKMKSIERANVTNTNILTHPEEVLGPTNISRGCNVDVNIDSRIECVNSTGALMKARAITLLYRRFVPSPEHCGLHDLHLVPTYCAETESSDRIVDPLSAVAAATEDTAASRFSPLHSKANSRLDAVDCFFTGPQEGFLYDVTAKGKKVELVSHYIYTALVKSVALEHNLLHALTETGLETYTLRIAHRALVQSYSEQVYPSSRDPVCLVGLRPFFGVEQLIMSDRHLVLVSTTDDSLSSTDSIEGNSCTIYSLRKPSPLQLFQDFFEVGLLNRLSSPPTYLHLLSEGHMILRSHLLLVGEQKCGREGMELYRESCALVGDYYACSTDTSEQEIANRYYVLSELPVENILQRFKDLKAQVKQKHVMQCLVLYLTQKLLDQKSDDTADLPLSTCENILEIFAEETPNLLWKIILLSNLSSYRTEKAMLLLKKRITSKKSVAGDTLAVVVLLYRKGNTEATQNMILSISKEELVPILVEVYKLLILDGKITPFGQMVKQFRPDAFIECLLNLVKLTHLTPDEIIEIMKKDSSQYETEYIPLIKEYLEALLSDRKLCCFATKNCITLLLKIYLNRLQQPQKPYGGRSGHSLSKSAILFGTRFTFCGDLPPFNGKGISRSCLLKKQTLDGEPYCHCWHCNEDLLRLQSLLCSDLCKPKVLSDFREFLKNVPSTTRGYLSLQVLSHDWQDAIAILSATHPNGLLPYSADTFNNKTEKWCQLFAIVKEEMEKPETDTELFDQIFQDLLGQLAEMLHPSAFLGLLPPNHDTEFYLPYVKRCVEKHQATLLKEKVIAIGMEVKAIM